MPGYRLLSVSVILLLVTLKAAAQSGINQLFISNGSDEYHLIDAYSTPLYKAIGANMNTGWTNTAAVNDHFTFDLRYNVSITSIPNAERSFDVSTIGLYSLVPADASKTITPTIGGGATAGPVYNLKSNGSVVNQFTLPRGQSSSVQTRQFQLTFGIAKNTDIIVRGTPSVDMGSDFGKYSMIGVGLKHNILKDIMDNEEKNVPFKLAVLLGYTHLNLNMPLSVQPIPNIPVAPFYGSQPINFSNQSLQAKFNSYVAQLILSDKIACVTPFLTVGYNTTSYNVNAIGNYPYLFYDTQYYYLPTANGYQKSAYGISALGVNLGFQVNIDRFRIGAAYNISDIQSSANYNTFTASGSIVF